MKPDSRVRLPLVLGAVASIALGLFGFAAFTYGLAREQRKQPHVLTAAEADPGIFYGADGIVYVDTAWSYRGRPAARASARARRYGLRVHGPPPLACPRGPVLRSTERRQMPQAPQCAVIVALPSGVVVVQNVTGCVPAGLAALQIAMHGSALASGVSPASAALPASDAALAVHGTSTTQLHAASAPHADRLFSCGLQTRGAIGESVVVNGSQWVWGGVPLDPELFELPQATASDTAPAPMRITKARTWLVRLQGFIDLEDCSGRAVR